MKITLLHQQKKALTMRSLSIELLSEALKEEKKEKKVSHFRALLAASLPGSKVAAAEKLPVIIFGGNYRRIDEKPTLHAYNGYVLLEVNQLTTPSEAIHIKKQAARMPQTLLAFIGSSGHSVKIIVRFTLFDGTLPNNPNTCKLFHAEAYQQAVKYYQPQLDAMITMKDPIINRGCRYSFDPWLYYNKHAAAILLDQPLKMPTSNEIRIIPDSPANPLERLMPGVDQLARLGTLYAVAMVQAIQTCTDYSLTNLKPLLIELAQNCAQAALPEAECVGWTLKHNLFKTLKIEVTATFRSVYLLQKAKQTHQYLPKEIAQTLLFDEFMTRRYHLRINKMNGDIEYLDRSEISFNYQAYSRMARNSICLEAREEGLDVWDKDVERYVYSNRISTFHPIEDYFEMLPTWDGTDHIRALAARIPTSKRAWKDRFFRWFLSMVAHWLQLDTEHANSGTPLLVGGQGCGKSTFCLNILPPVLRKYYTDSVDFSKRRESELALHRYALINIDEFDSIKSSQQSYLKHILQKAVVNTRLPYQASQQQLRRYATFIATSNNFDLLTDPTGSRRFLCVEVEGRIDYLQPIDYEQLYAQAKTLLMQGERYWFTPQEECEISNDNRLFQQIPIEEQLFLQYYTPAENIGEGEALLASEILSKIASKHKGFTPTSTIMRTFSRLLARNNVLSKHTRRGTSYYVVENEYEQIA